MHLVSKEHEPDMDTMDICEAVWHSKYKHMMNPQELRLAFMMNIRGELGEEKIKLTNFQFFSVDFFTDVLNAYLKERQATYKQQQAELEKMAAQNNKALPKPDKTTEVLERIILDFKIYHAIERELFKTDYEFASHDGFAVQTKIEYMDKMFEINTEVGHLIQLREVAAKWVLRNLAAKISELRSLSTKSASAGDSDDAPQSSSFGAISQLANQIARIQSGKLLNDADEKLIQHQVRRLLYIELLFLNKPDEAKGETLNDCAFVNLLNENITLFKNKK